MANDHPDHPTPGSVQAHLPAEVFDTCICLALHRATRAVGRRFDQAFRPLGLSNEQFSLLMALDRPQPPTLTEVARLLTLDRTTLTANLKPLQRLGWVDAQPDAVDRRVRRLELTALGRSVLVAAHTRWVQAHQGITDALDDSAALHAALGLLAERAINAGTPTQTTPINTADAPTMQ